MTNRIWRTWALSTAIASLAFAAACGADLTASGEARGVSDMPVAGLDEIGSIGAQQASLELRPADGAYTLSVEGLQGGKAIFGRVSYDATSQHYVGSQALERAEDSLFIAVDDPATGVVHVGWVLSNFDKRPGVSGSLELARISFASGAASQARRISTAPTGPDDQITIASAVANETTDLPELSWRESCTGDGNNDGVVSVQDLTPIGLFFGQNTTGGFEAIDDADYNKDGKVSVQDLTPIGLNFGTSLGGYAILSGPSAGSLTEVERVNRNDQFPGTPKPAGILLWTWTGDDPVTETTFFQVQPFDNAGNLGDASDVVQIEPNAPTQTPNDVTEIVFEGSDTWLKQGTDYAVILTELAVDSTQGNAEDIDILIEQIDLKAMVSIVEDPGNPIDGTSIVQWVLVEGGGLASVGNGATDKGVTSFKDRGRVVIEAHLAGDFTKSAQIAFRLFTIDSLALELAGGGTGPTAVNAGTDVDFTATGTFDWDGIVNGDELDRDLTSFVNWAVLPGSGNTGSFSLNTTLGLLNTDDAASGDSAQVVCEFPGTLEVTLFDNQRRSSDPVTVDIN